MAPRTLISRPEDKLISHPELVIQKTNPKLCQTKPLVAHGLHALAIEITHV